MLCGARRDLALESDVYAHSHCNMMYVVIQQCMNHFISYFAADQQVAMSFVLSLRWLTLVYCCKAWSLFDAKRAPPRSTQSLVEHLQRGPSRLNKDVSVVVVSHNECGIQFDGTWENKELAYVDRNEFVTSQCGRETQVGRAVQTYFSLHDDIREIHGNLLPSIYIAIFLCLTRQNKVSGGIHTPYLKTLPSLEALQHLPVFWDKQLLEELQDSAVKSAVQVRRNEWDEEYHIILEALQETGGNIVADFVNLETWYWARSIITSRAFGDNKDDLCLIPYVDMMNHIGQDQADSRGDVIKCGWKIDSSGFRLVLPEDMGNNSGEAKRIEISYGDNSNSNFLMNYGFSIVEDSQQTTENKAILSLCLPLQQEADQAMEILWEADGLGDCHDVCRNVTVNIGNPGPMQSLLSLCRVASSQGPELSSMQDAFVQKGETTSQTDDGLVPQLGATLCRSPFSVSNEIRAMERLQRVASDCLCKYKTTLAEDETLLHRGFSRRRRWFGRQRDFHRLRNAVIVRRGEKQIIQHFYNVATLALSFLRMANEDFEVYKGMLGATLENDEPCYNLL
jgi:hypothetical protein